MNYQEKYLKYKKKYTTLKELSRRQYGGVDIVVGEEIEGTINKIFYCGFSVKVDNKPLVLYVQKYGPAGGTVVPDMSKESSEEEVEFDRVTREELLNFWESEEITQANGNWKGGAWGGNNLITSGNWVSGGFIGDKIKLKVVAIGILPFSGGNAFGSTTIIPGSESKALSCSITLGDSTYAGYVTGNIMPQIANDVLFVYKNIEGKKFIKLLKRGVGPNVDMPKKMMPGAGEHLEPGDTVKFSNKQGGLEGVLRAIKEEIGIREETLEKCYLLDIGLYKSPGRDPRYWTYSIKRENGEMLDFGIKRSSESHGYIVYFESTSDKAPVETNPLDTEEINIKWWYPLNDTLLIDNEDWMIIDHKKLVVNAIIKIEQFNCLEEVKKEEYKMMK